MAAEITAPSRAIGMPSQAPKSTPAATVSSTAGNSTSERAA
jgi:hypothetical protein